MRTIEEARKQLIDRGWDFNRANALAYAVTSLEDAAEDLAEIDDPITAIWSNEVRELADHILTDRR